VTRSTADRIQAVLRAWRDVDTASDLMPVLKVLGAAVQADACIVWEESRRGPSGADSPPGILSVLSQWYGCGPHDCSGHQAPVGKSLTSRAILDDEIQATSDIWQPGSGAYLHLPFLRAAGIRAVASAPMRFHGGIRGAITVYRQADRTWEPSELHTLANAAEIIPLHHQLLRERLTFRTLHEIEEIVRANIQNTQDVRGDARPAAEISQPLGEICTVLAKTFSCVQVAVYLEDPTGARFERVAASCDLNDDPFDRRPIQPNERRLSAWVLRTGAPLSLFDLERLNVDSTAVQKRYPRLVWDGLRELPDAVRSQCMRSGGTPLPLLSYQGVPLRVRERTLGIVRCLARETSPYYFSQQDEELLSLVALRVAHFVSSWRSQRLWRVGVEGMYRIDRAVAEAIGEAIPEVSASRPSPYSQHSRDAAMEMLRRYCGEAIRLVREIIPEGTVVTARLIDDKLERLYWFETGQDLVPWDQPDNVAKFRAERDWIVGPHRERELFSNIAINTRRMVAIKDVHDPASAPRYLSHFNGVDWLVIAPIVVPEGVVGVLDVRGSHARPMPENRVKLIELIAEQLGLYYHLGRTNREIRDVEEEAFRRVSSFVSLRHVLESPLAMAATALSRVTTALAEGSLYPNDVRRVERLVRIARSITANISLYQDLMYDRPIRTSRQRLDVEQLHRLLGEATDDARELVSRGRGIEFVTNVDRNHGSRGRYISADPMLVRQAIWAVLDNAARYSYLNTQVRVATRVSVHRVSISVTNKGLPITPEEAHHVTERGWRGERAQAVVATGDGLGLWIVNSIMEAHGGVLTFHATDAAGATVVELDFPFEEEGR
jgi:signal transduction histidine kinase